MTTEVLKGRISDKTFDDFLAEQGLLEEAQNVAIKRVVDWQIADLITPHKSQTEIDTSRTVNPTPV